MELNTSSLKQAVAACGKWAGQSGAKDSTAPPDGSIIGPSVPGVSETSLGLNSTIVTVSTDQTYTVTFTAGDQPLEIDITQGNAASTSQAIRYTDLSVPAGVACKITLSPQSIDNLRYDKDGDGVFESQVTPTVSVTGIFRRDHRDHADGRRCADCQPHHHVA